MSWKSWISKFSNLDPRLSRRRLRVILLTLAVALILPISFLLKQTYSRLEREAFFMLRASAEDLTTQINQQLHDLLSREEHRPFDHYAFLRSQKGQVPRFLHLSPLASMPPNTPLPGLIGYFQIQPDGTLSSPHLPEELVDIRIYGVSREELRARQELVDRIKAILIRGQLLSFQAKQRLLQTPAFPEEEIDNLFEDAAFDAAAFEEFQKVIRRHLPSTAMSEPEQPEVKVQDMRLNTRYAQYRAQISMTIPQADAIRRRPRRSQVIGFEGETDPFQFQVLNTGEIIFFRKVWRDEQRYIQGFILQADALLKKLFEQNFYNSRLSQYSKMRVAYRGKIVERYLPKRQRDSNKSNATNERDSRGDHEILVLRAGLSAPFNPLELLFTVNQLPTTPGKRVVTTLAFLVFTVLTLGLIFIYKLVIGQMEVARQRSDFVSAVSHELKTPLTSIRMYGEMLRDGYVQDKDKQKQYYDFIFFESERLSRLIMNVLQLAKLSHQKPSISLKSMSAKDVLDFALEKVRPQIEAAHFKLDVPVSEEDRALGNRLLVEVDEDAVAQIFVNLTDNAIKFSAKQDPKQVDIGYRLVPKSRSEQCVQFFVRDYGPGVARDQKKKIFDLFYRPENEMTRTTPGTGIGLALVHQLATQLGAKVSLENRKPGAEFQVTMPATEQKKS